MLAGAAAPASAAPGSATPPGAEAHPASAEVQQARRILADHGYQTSLPTDPSLPELTSWRLDWLGKLFQILLWAGLVLAVSVAIAWVAARLGGRVRDVAVEEASAPASLEVPLASAERLAAAGRFAEAIHALLLETLAALSRAAQLAPSLTSREILSRVPLPERAREALAGLVLAVEISRFGGAPAGERDYRACLDRFHEFLETYRRGGRAEGAAA